MNAPKGRFKPVPIVILLSLIVGVSYWLFIFENNDDSISTLNSGQYQKNKDDRYYLKGYDLTGNVENFREFKLDLERLKSNSSLSNKSDLFKPEFTDYFFDNEERLVKEKFFVDGDFRSEVVYTWEDGAVTKIKITSNGQLYRLVRRYQITDPILQKETDLKYGPGSVIYRSAYTSSTGEHLFYRTDVIRKRKLLGEKTGPDSDSPDTYKDFYFNDLGQVSEMRWKTYVGETRMLVDLVFTYQYHEYDDHENWTGRLKKGEDGEVEEGVVRSINYY